jgi:DNA-binding response OmpR family regulator
MSSLGTILVAEDDGAIADVLVDILTEEGYAVQVVASGSDALAALQAEQIDLVLPDLSLPGMSRLEVFEAARVQQIEVPIVIMTASTHTADALAAASVTRRLFKPFDLDELLRCVAEHVRRR